MQAPAPFNAVPFFGHPQKTGEVPLKDFLPLPIEVVVPIFQSLSLQDQAQATLVCKDWNGLLKSHHFQLAELAHIHLLPKSHSLQTKFLLPHNWHQVEYITRSAQFVLMEGGEGTLLLLQLKKGKITSFHLTDNPNVQKTQQVAGAFFLRDDCLFTHSNQGADQGWLLRKNIVLSKDLRQEELQLDPMETPLLFQDARALTHIKKKAVWSLPHFFAPTRSNSLFAEKHSLPPYLFKVTLNQSQLLLKLKAKDITGEGKEAYLTEVSYPDSLKEKLYYLNYTDAQANERWVVTLCRTCYRGRGPYPMAEKFVLNLFDSKSGRHIWQCIEESAFRVEAPRFYEDQDPRMWLSEDFLLFWNGPQLTLFHIPLQKAICRFPLEQLVPKVIRKKKEKKNQELLFDGDSLGSEPQVVISKHYIINLSLKELSKEMASTAKSAFKRGRPQFRILWAGLHENRLLILQQKTQGAEKELELIQIPFPKLLSEREKPRSLIRRLTDLSLQKRGRSGRKKKGVADD
ncbi:MAG: hypothetical protein K0S07_1659 [Chlamydiales bacterium]|jgi:hypothetical protein|nr:hypothetical protein [Chlamydiales bacterium]